MEVAVVAAAVVAMVVVASSSSSFVVVAKIHSFLTAMACAVGGWAVVGL